MDYCPLCEGKELFNILTRERVLIHQNLLYSSEVEALNADVGELRMELCSTCGFIFNSKFKPELISYGADYDNRQTCSQEFRSYFEALAKKVLSHVSSENTQLVEIGCGNGEFLELLIEGIKGECRGYGFDPSYKGNEELLVGKIQILKQYYDESASKISADLVCCRHVIEHVPDPIGLLQSTHQALQDSPQARVFFETPCVEWILRNKVIWDFFYEHCSLFTKSSLAFAFEKTGFCVDSVDHVFGEQYLWLEARKQPCVLSSFEVADLEEIAHEYREAERREWDLWRETLGSHSKKGRVAVWGAGAKGATFASLLDPHREQISCIIDINPNKQGGWLGGSAHPVISPATAPSYGIEYVLVMNPLYISEIEQIMSNEGMKADIVESL